MAIVATTERTAPNRTAAIMTAVHRAMDRGHDLGDWHESGFGYTARCRTCNKQAGIWYMPRTDDWKVNGFAVGIDGSGYAMSGTCAEIMAPD